MIEWLHIEQRRVHRNGYPFVARIDLDEDGYAVRWDPILVRFAWLDYDWIVKTCAELGWTCERFAKEVYK